MRFGYRILDAKFLLIFYEKGIAFLKNTSYNITCVSGCGSAWLERRLREAEVASSNPATPMNIGTPKL